MAQINIAMVGIGRAGWGMHCKELESRDKTFAIYGCFDIDAERMTKMKERFPEIKAYASYEALLQDPAVDLVDIATPSKLHAGQCIAALKAGKTVFCEKPIATSLQEAKEMVATAEETGSKLFFRHNRRFEVHFQHIREIIASGKLGKVYEIRLHRHSYSRRSDWQTLKSCGGGQLNNWGPHIIDHSLQFLGGKYKELWSDLKRVAAVGDAEDHLKIIFKGMDGLIVDMEISGGVSLGQPTCIVYGDRGSLIGRGNKIELKYLDPFNALGEIEASPDSPPIDGSFGNAEKIRWITESFDADPELNVGTSGIWDYLGDSIMHGAEFPITTAEALGVMEVIEKVKAGTPFA